MPATRLAFTTALLGLWLIAPLRLAAQTPGGSTPAAAPVAGRSDGVQEVKPDVYYLKDKQGTYQPVLGFTLEDFERMLTVGAARTGGQPRPSYRLDRLSASGKVVEDRAELSLRFTIFVDDKDWVRIPMRLTGCVLRGEAKYDGPGDHMVEFDDASDEYVVWLRGASSKPHNLALEVLAPLTTLAGETRLKFSVPRAVNSQLALEVPGDHAVGQVSPGAVLVSAKAQGDRTEFKAEGLASDFMLAWRQGQGPVAEVPAVLEATGALVARIDGRSSNTQAQLTVRSFGGEFDSFRVRLPPGAILLGGDNSDYTVRPVDAVAPNGKPEPKGRVVEIRLRAKTTGPAHVRLVTEQTYEVVKQKQGLQLGGFEVIGAVRQWGHLAVQVVGEWQVAWGARSLIRQVEDLPPELWRDNLLAGFEYFGQPFTLVAHVAPRVTRINVEPEYLAMVGATRIDLEARLKYRIGGAKAFSFDVDLTGWRLDDVGPLGRVNPTELAGDNVSPLTIPLEEAASGEVELVVRAHRDLPADAKQIEFPLPKPRAGGIGPAPVVIVPADNVDLEPRESACVGLVRQYARPPIKLPIRQQSPLVYQCEAGDAKFVAEFHVAQRTIEVSTASDVHVGRSGGRVHQKFSYLIGREAVESLSLLVPAAVAEAGKLSATLGDAQLTWQPIESDTVDEGSPQLVRVGLPAATIGTCTLLVEYPWSEEEPQPHSSVRVDVPLVMPADGDLKTNEVTVTAEDGLRFQLLDPQWQEQPSLLKGGKTHKHASQLRLSAEAARGALALGVHTIDRPRADTAVVDRAWIRSWLSDDVRQDRAVYRLHTTRDHFAVRLPAGAVPTETVVDGQKVAPHEGAGPEELIVPLESQAADGTTVEIVYHFPERKQHEIGSQLELHAPGLEKGVFVDRQYWQLILPADAVLVDHSKSYTDESDWRWRGFHWDRVPLVGQFELESWCGARHETPLPGQARQYLLSTVGIEPLLRIDAMRLPYLILLGSGGALLCGLLLLYVRPLRHPAALLIYCVGLGVLIGLWPQAAAIVAQTALLGLLLVVLAVMLRRGLLRHAPARPVVRTSASSVFDRGSTQTQKHIRPPLSGSHSSTATVPLAAHLTGPESQS